MKRTNPVVLTHSELTMLRNCAWKHHLKYELSLDPAGGEDRTGPRSVGALIHLGIGAVYRTIQQLQLVKLKPNTQLLHAAVRNTLREAVEKARAETTMFVGEDAERARIEDAEEQEVAVKCLDLFVEHIALPGLERYDVIGVEVPFKVPILTQAGIRSGDELEGVIDLVLRDRSLGTIVCGEHKSTSSDASTYEMMLNTDPQIPLYIYALRQMFGPELVKGAVVLNVVRKSYPQQPKTNNDGTVSVAACDTTRDVYAAALQMQTAPEWWTKARLALDELLKEQVPDEKKIAKATEALNKADERWSENRAKQEGVLASLPTIDRFVKQFEDHIDDAHVGRAAQDAWNGARLIRLMRRELVVPWRNGSNCKAFNRTCEYIDACVENVIEPGDLLSKRDARHREVEEARAQGPVDVTAMLNAVSP